jgi:hypothetical protein
MRALAAALALAALGCARGPAPTATADGAIPAIAIHADRSGGRAVAVIAERREVEIVDGAFTVDDLLGEVVLASLAVEADRRRLAPGGAAVRAPGPGRGRVGRGRPSGRGHDRRGRPGGWRAALGRPGRRDRRRCRRSRPRAVARRGRGPGGGRAAGHRPALRGRGRYRAAPAPAGLHLVELCVVGALSSAAGRGRRGARRRRGDDPALRDRRAAGGPAAAGRGDAGRGAARRRDPGAGSGLVGDGHARR